MKKITITTFLIVILLGCMFCCENVTFAKEGQSAEFSLTSSQTNLTVGDTFEVNIVISSISEFSGINTFIAKKNFDKTIFEYISTEGKNGWELKGDDNKIVLRRETGESNSGIIATMKFKVLKADVNAKIQLTELDASGYNGDDVYYDDNNVNNPFITITIKDIENSNTNTPSIDTPNTDTEEPNNDGTGNTNNAGTSSDNNNGENKENNSNTSTKPAVNNDKTTSQNKIPQTGDNYVTIILVALATIMTVILYLKYRKIKNDMK